MLSYIFFLCSQQIQLTPLHTQPQFASNNTQYTDNYHDNHTVLTEHTNPYLSHMFDKFDVKPSSGQGSAEKFPHTAGSFPKKFPSLDENDTTNFYSGNNSESGNTHQTQSQQHVRNSRKGAMKSNKKGIYNSTRGYQDSTYISGMNGSGQSIVRLVCVLLCVCVCFMYCMYVVSVVCVLCICCVCVFLCTVYMHTYICGVV